MNAAPKLLAKTASISDPFDAYGHRVIGGCGCEVERFQSPSGIRGDLVLGSIAHPVVCTCHITRSQRSHHVAWPTHSPNCFIGRSSGHANAATAIGRVGTVRTARTSSRTVKSRCSTRYIGSRELIPHFTMKRATGRSSPRNGESRTCRIGGYCAKYGSRGRPAERDAAQLSECPTCCCKGNSACCGIAGAAYTDDYCLVGCAC